MVYKISPKKSKYYVEQDIHYFQKKYKGKPTVKGYLVEGERVAFHVPQQIHSVGEEVNYKDGIAVITKVNKRGVWIQPVDLRSSRESKEKYLTNKQVYRELTPSFENIPFIVGVPMYKD